MKRSIYILIIAAGFIITSCSKEEVNPQFEDAGPVSASSVMEIPEPDVVPNDGLFIVRIPKKDVKNNGGKDKVKSSGE